MLDARRWLARGTKVVWAMLLLALLGGSAAIGALQGANGRHGRAATLTPAQHRKADEALYRHAEHHLLGARARARANQPKPANPPAVAPPRPPGWEDQLAKLQVGAARERQRRNSSAARTQRKRSRTAFHREGRRAVASLARRTFPELLERPPTNPLGLDKDERVLAYESPYDALVQLEQPDGKPTTAVAESTLPLRSAVGSGEPEPVSLDLQERASSFEPENPSTELRIAKDPGAGVSIGHQGVKLVGAESSDPATLTGNTVLFANAGGAVHDDDFMVTPTPAGVEVAWQLRSARSPETLPVSFDLPPGAQLQKQGAGGQDAVNIVDDRGRVLATVSPVIAYDADDHPVEASYEVSGRTVRIHIDHRSKDLAYPILVDPFVQASNAVDHYLTSDSNQLLSDCTGGFQRPAGRWQFYPDNPDTRSQYWARWEYCDGLDVRRQGSAGAWGDIGQWYLPVPRVNAYFARTEMWAWHNTFYDSAGNVGSCMVEGMNDWTTYNWYTGGGWTYSSTGAATGAEPYVWDACRSLGLTYVRHEYDTNPGNHSQGAMFGLMSAGNAAAINSSARLRAATIYLNDHDYPTLSASDTDRPAGWVERATPTVSATAADATLGVHWIQLRLPNGSADAAYKTVDFGCTGGNKYPCPQYPAAQSIPYDTDDVDSQAAGNQPMPEGLNTVTARATDATGKASPDVSASLSPVKIDRTPPASDPSGALWDRRGQDLPPGTYDLRIDARDGTQGGADSAKRSGVRSIEIIVDGDEADYAEQDCSTDSCPMTRTWSFDTSQYGGGDHSIKMIVTDQIGHESSQSFTVHTACCLAAAGPWGNSGPLDDVSFGDVDGDNLDDLVGRNRATGDLMVALSTGTQFATPVSWGRWTPLDPISHLLVKDVTGDGLDDLVGRDPVTNDVLVAASTGSSFAAPTRWTTWPATRELQLGDADDDGIADLIGRDLTTGELRVALSTGSAFAADSSWGSFDTAYDIKVADVDGEGTEDVVGRNRQTGEVRVALSTAASFASAAQWGSTGVTDDWALGDGNDDGQEDLFARDPTSGDVRVAKSTGSSFGTTERWGNLPPQYTFNAADPNGDAEADAAGLLTLTGEVQVALADVAVPDAVVSSDYVPDSSVVDEPEDPLDPPKDPEPDVPPLNPAPVADASASATGPKRMVLGYQDQKRLFEREVLDDPNNPNQPNKPLSPALEAPVTCSGSDTNCTTGDNRIRAIYNRLAQAGVTLIRFNVNVAEFNSTCTEPSTNHARSDRAIALAREPSTLRPNGFRVYITLTADADQQVPATFGQLVYCAVKHFQPLGVGTYSILNEPNFTVDADNAAARAALYRLLYMAGYSKAKEANKAKPVKVLIGELSSYKKGYNATTFLQKVVEPGQIKTDGVAWHPYSNRVQSECKTTQGIEKFATIQNAIKGLWKDTDPSRNHMLVTPQGSRKALLLR
ncbi:MAG: FG-GAP repeat domain-containing protein [Gaiellaceae bacterium]